MDFSDAYLQVELDDDSKQLCSINTHRGVYECQRLPFGVKSAPGIFQAIMGKMLAGLPFATAYLDDIVVVSRSQDDHRRHMPAVFDRMNEYGFRVRPGKCSQPSIKYIGFIIDKGGRRPDPQKITAVADMLEPTNITTLRSIRQPLEDLKKDNEWTWSARCQQAFESIKDILNSDHLLTHYDPSRRKRQNMEWAPS
jgi:hypothetical protein